MKSLHQGLFRCDGQFGTICRLLGSRCPRCGHITFPPKLICPACHYQEEQSEIELSTRGKLHTYTTVHAAPSGFTTPYVVGYVDLPEGVRVFAQITSGGDLQIGMEMESVCAVVYKDEQGEAVLGYQFRPVATRGSVKS